MNSEADNQAKQVSASRSVMTANASRRGQHVLSVLERSERCTRSRNGVRHGSTIRKHPLDAGRGQPPQKREADPFGALVDDATRRGRR